MISVHDKELKFMFLTFTIAGLIYLSVTLRMIQTNTDHFIVMAPDINEKIVSRKTVPIIESNVYGGFSEEQSIKSDDDDMLDNTTDKRYQGGNYSDCKDMKYILEWTSLMLFKSKGRQVFIDKKCPHTNCFVTTDRTYLGGDITKFDVIAFPPSVFYMNQEFLPPIRSLHQKYAFVTMESSDNYPLCSNRFNEFFNWTWTFRLDSEIKWGYIVIRDKNFRVVGPKKKMHWIKDADMKPLINDEFIKQLKSKTLAAACFVSQFSTIRKRETFVENLIKELAVFNLTLDIYSESGPLVCPRIADTTCFDLIKKQYYFYLSFENSFDEDYVTEKLLNAVQNNAVPVVYGGANYSRFLPVNSFLNARKLGAKALAAKMYNLIKHPNEYYKYFRWRNYYSYHYTEESVETDGYCLACAMLNNKKLVKEQKIYKNFTEWWDKPRCK